MLDQPQKQTNPLGALTRSLLAAGIGQMPIRQPIGFAAGGIINEQTHPQLAGSVTPSTAMQPVGSLGRAPKPSGISAPPNFGDNSSAGLNARLQFMQSQNAGVQIGDASKPLDSSQEISQTANSPLNAGAPRETTWQEDSDARQARINDMASSLKTMEANGRANSLMGSSSSITRSVPGFAEGGVIQKETPDELMARMAAKYGAPNSNPMKQAAPQASPPPVAPAPKSSNPLTALTGIFSRRKEQIDKASGYANGGKIKGPGTPTSDSIPAQVRETGEPIKVSTQERIVSHAQEGVLQGLAKRLGFDGLDQLLEAGTGRPVGPTINAGKRAAENGLSPDDEARRMNYLTAQSSPAGISSNTSTNRNPMATPTTMMSLQRPANQLPEMRSSAPLGIAAPTATDPDTDGRRQYSPGYGEAFANRGGVSYGSAGLTALDQQPAPRDDSGYSAARDASRTNPLSASANIGGRQSAPNENESVLASRQRAHQVQNKLREFRDVGAGITAQRGQNGQLSIGNFGTENITDSGKRALDDSASALIDQKNSTYNPARQLENMQRLRLTSDLTDSTITDPAVRDHAAKALGIMGNPLDQQIKRNRIEAGSIANASSSQLGKLKEQYVNETDPNTQSAQAEKIRVITGKGRNDAGDKLTLPQVRSNFEIDAARKAVSGLTAEEIKRKTSNYTATGRENPDFDPTMAKAVSLANRRKYGADDHFDQNQQTQQPAGSDGDVTTRFRSDQAMQGHKLGKQTDMGVEVLDASGKLVGHYR